MDSQIVKYLKEEIYKMNKGLILIAFLFLALFFSPFQISRAQEYGLTPGQKHFSSILMETKKARRVEWRTPVSLFLEFSEQSLAPNPAEVAASLADSLAERGKYATRQPLCVHIISGRLGELARACRFE